MVVVGAKGLAKEVLEVCHQLNELENLCFFDNISNNTVNKLFCKFPILKTFEEVEKYFMEIDSKFTIGIGKPYLRQKLTEQFINLNGIYTSTISPKADIGSYDVIIGKGANILDGVKISNSVKIGIGSLIYYNAIITHDCEFGDFVEISPNATILGRVKIGNLTQIGANATILPDVVIGNNVVVGAGAVVTRNVPSNSIVKGIPAK